MLVENREFLDEHWMKALLETFENSIDSVVITSTSPEEHFLYINEAFKRKTGYTEKDLLGKSPRILQGPQTNRKVLDELKSDLLAGHNFVGKNTNYRKNGTTYIVHWYIAALKNERQETVGYISYQKEITQEVWTKEHLVLLASIVNQIDQMVIATDLLGNIVYLNHAFTNKYGYKESELLGKNIRIIKSGNQSDSFYKNLWETLLTNKSFHANFINKQKDGTIFVEQKTITPIKNSSGNVNFYVSIGQDITKLMDERNNYKEQAYKDPLTGLYNRLMINELLESKFSPSHTHHIWSLIMIDIDNFKQINDMYGHDKGDIVLKTLAHLMLSKIRKEDVLVRWGGEEFMVVVENNKEVATLLAEKICKSIREIVVLEKKIITVSVGVTQKQDSDTGDSLFQRVDKAMYRSKKTGKNKVTIL